MGNVILIGMPGSGKSTLGVVIAKKLNMRFIDSDLVIQEKYGKTLEELIDENGDAGFIKIENDVNAGINADNAVIATGGSAVYGDGAMRHFKDIGLVVFLDVPVEEIQERIGSLKERGVVSNGKTGIDEIFADRDMLYRKYADVIYSQRNNMLRESVEELCQIIKDNRR